MKNLSNEELVTSIESFPQHTMPKEQVESISQNLTVLFNQSEIKRSKSIMHSLLPRVLSLGFLMIFFIGISIFVFDNHHLNKNNQDREAINKSPIRENFFFSIETEDKFQIKEINDEAAEFFIADKKVDGVEILTEQEMNEDLVNQHIFKNEEVKGFKYPLKKTLAHIKTMDVTQIQHYYFLSKKSSLRYLVYFYYPDFNEKEADRIARSFKMF